MQKLILLDSLYNSDIHRINNSFLDKGWVVKDIIMADTDNKKFLFLLEKIGRKEKLENLDKLNQT